MNQLEQGSEETLTAAGRDAARQAAKDTLTAAKVTEYFRLRDCHEQQLQTTQEERETPAQIAGAGRQSFFHQAKKRNQLKCERLYKAAPPIPTQAGRISMLRAHCSCKGKWDIETFLLILKLLLASAPKSADCGANVTHRHCPAMKDS